ncbi:TPA: integrase [Enterobacter hormaechei subsp. oharae]|nr:integrase [Enterobacter hormaechei subsp. oharae]
MHKYLSAAKEHRVPLSDAVVALLKDLPRLKDNNHVFPAPRAETLSDMSLLAVLKRMGHSDLTQHGFRSTFREWAGETTDYQREVIEHALKKDSLIQDTRICLGDILCRRKSLHNYLLRNL